MISVVIPWQGDCPHRRAALGWVVPQWQAVADEVVLGCPNGDYWSKGEAVANALRSTSGDRIVVADADVWCDPTRALEELDEAPWTVPHLKVNRLSEESTAHVLAGADWHGLPLEQVRRNRYTGQRGGGIVMLRRDVIERVPLDPRFHGWGHEDPAWDIALTSLVGLPWRGTEDLVHLWHPPQERLDRNTGSRASVALLSRYTSARTDRERLRALVAEGVMV